MVATVILPFLMSMLLGRTIDLTNYKIGSNIYDDDDYTETKLYDLNATYFVIGKDSIPYDSFGMPVDIALRIKANQIRSVSGSMGLDGLLKDTSWLHNSVVVAASTIYRTVTRSLKDDAELLKNWQMRIPSTQTHYASSVTYGGWFVILYRFQCDIPSDAASVEKNVLEVLGTHGALKSNTLELWNLVRQKVMSNSQVRGVVIVDSFVFSSVDLPMEIKSPNDIYKVIQQFPETIGKIGTPLHMELKPLAELDSSYPSVSKVEKHKNDLLQVDQMFDDLRYTRSKIIQWVSKSDGIDEDEEVEVANLLDKVTSCLRTFFLLVARVSLYTDTEGEDIHSAIRAYNEGLEDSASSYNLAYLRLREDVDTSCEDQFLHGIKGLLKVYEHEGVHVVEVGAGGIDDCKSRCLEEVRCKAIGYSDEIVELDLQSGNYVNKQNQCWVYFRSTSTSIVHTPNGMSGDMRVYDRLCL